MARKYSPAKHLSWRLEHLGYLFMETVLRFVPLPAIDRLGSAIGFLFFYLSPRYRKLAIRNLRIALGRELSLEEIHRLARATCQRTIANFLGALKTTILPTEKIDQHVTLQGSEHLQSALSKGKGAILVLGHMGNWEVLNRLHQLLPPGTLAGGVYQPLKNPLVNQHLLKRREQDGSRLFNKRDGFHGPASFVKCGGLLIVVADQKVKGGSPIPFFDRLSSLSPLPALLARKTQAPVFAAGIETIAAGHWRVVLQPLPDLPATENIITALEKLIRRSPADYLWLHNRWRMDGRRPLSVSRKEPRTAPGATSPVRVLIIGNHLPDYSKLKAFLDRRRPQDLPLCCEFLIITPQPELTTNSTPFTVEQLVAPTPRELASRIHALDIRQALPLELVVLDPPTALTKEALSLLALPGTLENRNNLPLSDFLATQTAPEK